LVLLDAGRRGRLRSQGDGVIDCFILFVPGLIKINPLPQPT